MYRTSTGEAAVGRLDGKAVLVTGAARGLGDIVAGLAAAGRADTTGTEITCDGGATIGPRHL